MTSESFSGGFDFRPGRGSKPSIFPICVAGLLSVIAGLLSAVIPPRVSAVCHVGGNRLSLLRWSKDGNSALMLAIFAHRAEFIVIEGNTGRTHSFPFDINSTGILRPSEHPTQDMITVTNELDSQGCKKNMDELNSLLTKDQIENMFLTEELCQRKGPRAFPENYLGPEDAHDVILKSDKSGTYESEAISPGGLLKFQFEGNLLCGGDTVILYRRGSTGYSEFRRW